LEILKKYLLGHIIVLF